MSLQDYIDETNRLKKEIESIKLFSNGQAKVIKKYNNMFDKLDESIKKEKDHVEETQKYLSTSKGNNNLKEYEEGKWKELNLIQHIIKELKTETWK